MDYYNDNDLRKQIDIIVQDFLYQVSRHIKHRFLPFNDQHTGYDIKSTFQIISKPDINKLIVNEERLLEGCIRVFLINPIFDVLFKHHGIPIDWRFGNPFSNFDITTREYELVSFIEFIILYNNQNIGYRYTSGAINGSEPSSALSECFDYVIKQNQIPGFDELKTVDKVFAIDWSGKKNERNKATDTLRNIIHKITLEDFFCTYFKNYDLFVEITSNAVEKAKKILAIKATVQLSKESMFSFKQVVLHELSKEAMSCRQYEFSDSSLSNKLSNDDIQIINNKFYNEKLIISIIGKRGFSKCFITSEYLYHTINNNLSIDYTAVIAGYLKSVEQLLYYYYESAYGDNNRLHCWVKLKKNETYDLSDSKRYRIDPYNHSQIQKCIFQNKKQPAIGELVYFLRYYNSSWSISDAGKEYVVSCLLDYCKYCRNSHFHKDNIEVTHYEMVSRVRNNTIICLYYILGSFKLLNSKKSVNEQLGIINYSFEEFYHSIRVARFLRIKINDDYDGYVFFTDRNLYREYDEYGNIIDKELHFIKIDSLLTINDNGWYEYDEKILNSSLNDHNYLSQNTLTITNENLPEKIEIANIRRRYDRKK